MANVITVSVKMTDIDPKPEFQPRVKLDLETIEEYARQIKDGVEFPPIIVFKQEKGGYVLAAGYHRYEAHKILDKEEIVVDVRDYTSEIDILKHAIESNASHGKPFSRADKRKAVTLILKKAPDWSDWHIARLCKVSNHLVKEVRDSLGLKKSSTTVTATRNGTTYAVETKNIAADRSPLALSKLLESKVNNLIKTVDAFMLAHQNPDIDVHPAFDAKMQELNNWYQTRKGGVL